MPNFVRVNPPGWAANVILAAAHMNQLDIDHAASVNGDGGGSYNGDLTWNGEHNFGNLVTHDGQVDLNDQTNLSALLTLVGSTAGIRHREGTLADADATIDVSVDTYYFSTAPTVARTYTLRSTTAPVPAQGQRIRVSMTLASAFAPAIFQREDTTEIGRIGAGGAGGFLEFEYSTAKGWFVIGAGGDGAYTIPH